jgi:hypothetical protein
MAVNKAKRSIPSTQLGLTKRRSRTSTAAPRPALPSSRRLFRFPQARGKTVEAVEFSTDSSFHAISVNFQDRTSLTFEIETGFTLQADFSDWNTGNQRVLRSWRPVRSS